MRVMEPGESYDIEIAIPSDHIPGTNWYHPHAHGSADVQIASGAVGALIIEGDFADVPEIAAAKERLLVLTEAAFDRFGMVEEFGTLFPETPAALLRRERRPRTDHHHAAWRGAALAHPARGLAGRLVPGLGRAHAEFDRPRRHPVSRMGLTVPIKPDRPTDHPNAMLKAPGQRIDVLVQAGEPGTYALRAVPYDQGYASPTSGRSPGS